MNKFNVRNKYSPRIGVVVETGLETKTQKHFKDQCDINKIAKMVEATGSTQHVKQARERFGNFEDVFDYGANMDKAAKAQQLFERLPTHIRKKVQNSIPAFFNYIQDPDNFQECVKWGIYDEPKKDPTPAAPAAGDITPSNSTKSGKLKKSVKLPDESPDNE